MAALLLTKVVSDLLYLLAVFPSIIFLLLGFVGSLILKLRFYKSRGNPVRRLLLEELGD